jgi:hypothetical protein
MNKRDFASNAKPPSKESVMSLVKESVKEIFKNKKRKVASTFNVEKEEFNASDFKNLQLSDNESSEEDK